MLIPLEIFARIIEYVDGHRDLHVTLSLRLLSRTTNHVVLKVLLQSDELNPRNTEKLIEINRVRLSPQYVTKQAVRWRKRHARSDDETGEIRHPVRRTCFIGPPYNRPSTLDELDPRPLPASLLRPYLEARMERAGKEPCLLSVLIDRSVDLIMDHEVSASYHDRQKLFSKRVAAFNTDLIHDRPPFAKEMFSALFDTHGLDYWLPIYDAARLTTYPDPEHSLRLFYLLRIVQTYIHTIDFDARFDEIPDTSRRIFSLLEHPPAGPEYARLFAIDALNIIAKAKKVVEANVEGIDLMATFLATNTLCPLTVAERVWCAAKQGHHDLTEILICKTYERNAVNPENLGKLVLMALWIVDGMVEDGEHTHFGRSVIEDVLRCQDSDAMEGISKAVHSLEYP